MIDPLYLYSMLGAFAVLFVLSAIEKSRDTVTFANLVRDYQLIPESLIAPVTAAIVAAEALTAIMLVTPAYVYGAVSGTVILLVYAVAIGINLMRGRTHIDCGCLASPNEGGISYGHVVRNLLLSGLLACCVLPVATRELLLLDYLIMPLFLLAAGTGYATLGLLLAYQVNVRTWWS